MGVGDCAGEALTGERVGRVLSREIHETSGVPTLWEEAEGHIQRAASARRDGTPRGRRPRARAEAPRSGTGRSRGPRRPGAPPGASGSRWTYADDARPREVGPLDSTVDAAEQRRATGRGGGRGKRADQGELVRRPRRPDAVPDTRVDGPRASTSGSQPDPPLLSARCAPLAGSTFNGSCLKIGWVDLGLHLEFHAGDQWIITSHVRAIGVELSATGAPC